MNDYNLEKILSSLRKIKAPADSIARAKGRVFQYVSKSKTERPIIKGGKINFLTFFNNMQKRTAYSALIGLFILAILVWGWAIFGVSGPISSNEPKIVPVLPPFFGEENSAVLAFTQFKSEDEFKNYLGEAAKIATMAMPSAGMPVEDLDLIMPSEPGLTTESAFRAPSRVSETTVQVKGIDEPDIVKTDGKEIYYSQTEWTRGSYQEGEWIPGKKLSETKFVKAFPPEEMVLDSRIAQGGELLLAEETLVIFNQNKIFGFDASNPKEPKEKWSITIDEKTEIVTSRLYQGKIYLISRQVINFYDPCPMVPLLEGDRELMIRCTDIYYPSFITPVDVTYHAMVLNPANGQIEKRISFVGASESSVVYMSVNNLFVAYSQPGDFIKIFADFVNVAAADLFPSTVRQRINAVANYDISAEAKEAELEAIMRNFGESLSRDEQLKLANEMGNRTQKYFQEKARELSSTGIVKISLDQFEVKATGQIPGSLLNQFSLDEYQGFLRTATTAGEGFGFFDAGRESSVNDLYILDENLKTVGQVLDMGKGERIYSARFVEDKGYLVTFRETDPFYVLDLSSPTRPELKGELKIPGYSSYLEPITKDKILGIGKEDNKIKVSLFDVSNPSNPKEASKYILDEYWSDILRTHHAFLLDIKHEIFFLPGGKGGYIFSYKGDILSLQKAISEQVERAIYLDDYLYMIGKEKIVVLDERSWEKVREFEL